MKILITGHKGFIGSNLIPLLGDYTVRGWDLVQDHDIFDDDFSKQVKWADVVIHLVALTNVTGSFNNQEEHFRINTLGTARVLELCLKYKKRLIYPSTGAIHIPNTSPYALTKMYAELLVQKASEFIPITILRFFNIYGKGKHANFNSILFQFLEGARKGKIEVYGAGKGKRDFINVTDIVQVIKASLSKEWIGEIVEVGSGKLTSIKELAKIFGKETVTPVEFDNTKKEIAWITPDLTNLKRLYKKKLKTDVKKDVKEIINGWDIKQFLNL